MRSAHHLEWDRTLELDGSNPHPHQKTMLIDLSKLFIQSLLTRQYKDLKPDQQALRRPQAPHHAGLFALGS
jgi:hypothetical protein